MLVLPGQFLATREEFEPGEYVVEEEGNIYATTLGTLKEDLERRRISVRPLKKWKVKVGDVIIGDVKAIFPSFVVITLPRGKYFKIGDAILHISQVKRGFVKDLRREFKVGDIVRAKVIKVDRLAVYLSTVGEEFGIIQAFCARCRGPMEYKNNVLYCAKCKLSELRKISSLYGRVSHES